MSESEKGGLVSVGSAIYLREGQFDKQRWSKITSQRIETGEKNALCYNVLQLPSVSAEALQTLYLVP